MELKCRGEEILFFIFLLGSVKILFFMFNLVSEKHLIFRLKTFQVGNVHICFWDERYLTIASRMNGIGH